jgi:cysteine desulfurase
MTEKSIFFDHSSTTPVDPEVLEAMLPFFKTEFGNPSSHVNPKGQFALQALDKSRKIVAKMINAQSDELIFTSGATESNNLAIKGLTAASSERGKHIIISEIEHFSVLNTVKSLEKQGYSVDLIPVDKYGVIKLDRLESLLRDDTVLVSVMLSNTEIGTIEPVKEAVEIVKSFDPEILFHTDAASSAGWIPINVKDLNVDSLTLSAHNYYGPKGIGALYIKQDTKIVPLFDGGFQEFGIRSGTENVPGIVGMAKASDLAMREMENRNKLQEKLQKRLWTGLSEKLDFIHQTGHPEKRLPGHVSFWIEFAEGEALILFLQVKGIIAASGSACSSNLRALNEGELIHSHVLAAVGVPTNICSGSITFFLGKDNTEEEVDYVIEEFPKIVDRLWAMSPAYSDMLKEKSTS